MKYVSLLILLMFLALTGCNRNVCNEIPYWDGKSIKDFEGKTMASMLWLWPPPYQEGVGYCLKRSRVFKRFDEADFKVLLGCLENPDIKQLLSEQRLGRYLYLSFLDGTQYIVDFRFSRQKEVVILLNGQSKTLYDLLGEKEPCPTFEPADPRMDLYGEVTDPNIIMQ